MFWLHKDAQKFKQEFEKCQKEMGEQSQSDLAQEPEKTKKDTEAEEPASS